MKITIVVDDRGHPDSPLKPEHGVSFLIEANSRTVLFDTGQTGPVLLHNLDALGVDLEGLDAVILSHGHDDHTGGLPALLARTPKIPVHGHPDLLRKRFRKTDTGPRQIGPSVSRKALAKRAILQFSAEAMEVVPGVWTTGEVAPRPEPEGRSPYHVVRRGSAWVEDPYRDDLAVVLEAEEGLVLVCGCCHAGLLNTLTHVRHTFGRAPVAVVGGTHLVHADAPTLSGVIEELGNYGSPQLHVGHCTGDRGFLMLKAAFGDKVSLYHVGIELTF